MNDDNTSSDNGNNSRQGINSRQYPTLLMQADPRLVVTANDKACELFGKDLSEIEGHRGGEVFDCIHSFTEAGCGLDENCTDCEIKSAVLDTFATGKQINVHAVLDIKKEDEVAPYAMVISTEKTGEFVLINVIKYERQP